jgi:hypothetical protein
MGWHLLNGLASGLDSTRVFPEGGNSADAAEAPEPYAWNSGASVSRANVAFTPEETSRHRGYPCVRPRGPSRQQAGRRPEHEHGPPARTHALATRAEVECPREEPTRREPQSTANRCAAHAAGLQDGHFRMIDVGPADGEGAVSHVCADAHGDVGIGGGSDVSVERGAIARRDVHMLSGAESQFTCSLGASWRAQRSDQ